MDKSSSKMPKIGDLGDFFENLKMRLFWWFSTTVLFVSIQTEWLRGYKNRIFTKLSVKPCQLGHALTGCYYICLMRHPVHTVKKSQIVSKNSIFRKIQNSEFPIFLRIFKYKNYLNNLNFRAKNRNFDQWLKAIEFWRYFWRQNSKINRKSMYKNHNKSLIFGTKIQIHNFSFFLKIEFLDPIC